MVRAVAALVDFCYLVRRNVIDEDSLAAIENALARFHEHREIFRELGVQPDGFSLPRQHSLVHYPFLITQFGAPNGLCSSITESKHIKAIKRPYRRSSRNKALGQILVTNQRLDKLAAAHVDLDFWGLLDGPSVIGPLLDLVNSRYPRPLDNNPTPPFSQENIPPAAPLSVPPVSQNEELEEAGTIDDIVDEPESHSEITLVKTYGAWASFGSWI
jgi:hypothetical protein